MRTEAGVQPTIAAYEPPTVRSDADTVLGTVVLRWCPHDEAVPLKR